MKNQHIFTSLTVALCALPLALDAQTLPKVYNPGSMLQGMSDNAAYAIGVVMGDDNVDNPLPVGGKMIDLNSLKQYEITSPSGWAEVNDVADNGIVVGASSGRPGYWDPATGSWTTFKVPSEWGGGSFNAVTPDAHYAVGYFFDPQNIYAVGPMMYDLTTGEQISLPNLPTVDLAGEDKRQNVFYGISPDGRYILGEMSQSYLMPVSPVTYVYDRNDDTWRAIGYSYDPATKIYVNKMQNMHFIGNQFMSADGKYVAGSAYMVFNGGEIMGGTEGYCPYRYEIETDNLVIYSSQADLDIAGNKIAPDGTLLGSSPMGNPYPTAQVRYGKYFISLDQIFEQVYGVTPNQLIHDSVTGSFQALSADGLTALMCTHDNSYIITMPESFAEAASKVDLLHNYSINIPDGSTINRISELQITFERAIDCLSYPQDIKLLDSQGNVVRSASGVSISKTNDHTLVVTFRSTTLKAGDTYVVDIPAGMVWIKDDTSVKAGAIKIHYVGREDGPVQVKSVMPANGSAVAQFNSNPDFLTITFDTPVAIAQDFNCTLYNADDGSVITTMNAAPSGHQAIFFPTATYQLYKGTNYKVVIAAGSVTDLSGGGGNEEIVLNYTGAYVRQLSPDDKYVFYSNCDNYENFMFWKSTFNQPSARPESWGFTSEIPWLLVRDDETSTDMALAAHSMFMPAGQADDWLITPQLYIPDATTYLAFDAQSYLRARNDVLKVYVYTTDAVYNYFSEELRDIFANDGDLVFDEIVSAGDTDEGLKDEWTHCVVNLEKYAGKNVYIAFVNYNYDKSAIFLDNIQVIRNLNFLLTNQTPSTVVDKDQITVTGTLTIGTEVTTYKGIDLKLIDDQGNEVDQIVDNDVTLGYGDSYKFTFNKPLEITPGFETSYTIELIAGEDKTSFLFGVKDLIFEPVKRVVLEEFTGSACGNCPLGIQAIENLQKLYPDNFIAITLRTYMNDMYATGITDYTSFLGLNAAPTGRINRGAILAPMMQNGTNGYLFFGRGIETSDGSEAYLWADAVQDELNVPAEAEVDLTATYDPTTGEITVPCNVRFALERKDMSIGLFAVVIENNLPTYQLNYFSGISDPNLGPWGVGGMYSQQTVTSWLASDVARFVINGRAFNGTTIPESYFSPGNDYKLTLSSNIPEKRITNPENCKVVVMIIDNSNGRILNAAEAKLKTGGINDIINDDLSDAEYYDMQGIKVQCPEKGRIYIKVVNGHASKVRF